MAIHEFNRSGKIVSGIRQPRRDHLRLIEIAACLSPYAMAVLDDSAASYAGNFPRHSPPPSFDQSKLSDDVARLARIAELVSDEGLKRMLEKASSLSNEHPALNAKVISLQI